MSGAKRLKEGFLLTLLILMSAATIVDVAMASPIAVAVDPLSIIDPAMVPGTQFSIDITVDYITRLQGYQFLMFFNPDVLNGVSVENGPFLESAGATPQFYPGQGFDNTEGLLYLVVGMLPSNLPPPKYPIGGGVLATVTFEVVGTGASNLTLGPETGLLNMTGGYGFNGEWCYGFYPVPEYPGGPPEWVEDHPLAQAWRDKLGEGSGYFANEQFELEIITAEADSTPIPEVDFILDGGSETTDPEGIFSMNLSPGNHTIEMPAEFTVDTIEYSFLYWEDESTNATRIVDLTSNMSLIAYYTKAGEYRLTIESTPITDVNFTLDDMPYETPFNETLPAGSYTIKMPIIWAINETAYTFKAWADNPTASSTRTIGLTSDMSLTATYVEEEYMLTIESTPISGVNFTLDDDPYQTPFSQLLPGGSYIINMSSSWRVGETVYEFLAWDDDPAANSARTVELASNTSLTARYIEAAEYQFEVDSTPIAGVSFTIDGDSFQTPFSEVLPAGGYTIKMPAEWKIGEDVYEFLGWKDLVPEEQRTITLASNTSITAMYLLGLKRYDIKINTTLVDSTPIEGMNFTLDGSLETTPFFSNMESKKHVVQMPSEWDLEGTRCWFVNWTDDGSTNPTRVVDLTTNMSLTAIYTNRSVRNINKNTYYEAIQDAIDDADPDDTIVAYPKTYYEHLWIDKPLTLLGKDSATTIIDGITDLLLEIISIIDVDNVTISGFTMKNTEWTCIYMSGSNYNTISGNIFLNCWDAIWAESSSNLNTISNNIVANSIWGIELFDSEDNIIVGNTFSSNDDYGLALWGCFNTTIYHNNFLNNAFTETIKNATLVKENNSWVSPGNVYLSDNLYTNASAEGANVTYHGYGFSEITSLGFIPRNITKVEVGVEAFCPDVDDYIQVQVSWNNGANWSSLFDYVPPTSDSNVTSYIDVTNARKWTWDELSDGNFIVKISKRTVGEQNITYVDWLPVRVTSALQAYDDGDNLWDNGYPSGGNYWSDYTGEDEKIGPNQDIIQPFADGIGDTPYRFLDTGLDHYPLIEPSPMTFLVAWDGEFYPVEIISNSTITAFKFSQQDMQISFNVTGPDGTTGFCEVKIPRELLDAAPDEWTVLVDGTPVIFDVGSKSTCNILSFTYAHSTKTLEIEGATVVDNVPPIANAEETAPRAVDEDVVDGVTFDGSASWDDVAIKEYTWTFEEDGDLTVLVGKIKSYTFETPGFYVVTLEVTDSGDNADTDIVLITVRDITDPDADASETNTTVDEDTPLMLDGSASSDNVGIVEYKWYVEDVPANKTLSGEKKTYEGWVTPGVYNVTLEVTDAAGHWATDTVWVTVGDVTKPVANASKTATAVREDTQVILDGSASSDNVGIVEYKWYVEDVPPQTLYGMNATYEGWVTPGVYNVTLEVTDAAGNWNTDQLNITVLDITKPTADAGPSQIVYEDTLVTLDGSGSWDNDPFHDLNYTWTFFNGTLNVTLTGVKPTYNFTSPSDYTITLNVTDTAGNWDTDKVIIMVRDATVPIAIAYVSPNNTIDEGTLVTFDGSDSMDNVGIESYKWGFTDGGVPQILNGVNATYTFDNPGVYPVTLTVTDGEGKSDTTTIIITVLDITDPVANAGLNQTVNEDTLVALDGSGSTDNVGIESYVWTFMEGDTLRTLMGAKPNYIFVTPGVFVVTLNVTDAVGHSDAGEVQITVRDVTPPVANAGTDQVVDKDTLVILDGSASSDNHLLSITNYTWTFVDVTAQTLSGVVANYSFTTPGVYVVTLNVTDAVGLWSIDTVTISVLQGQSSTDSGFATIWDIVLVALVGVAIAIGIASFVRREHKS